jgi:hypothetical protein
MQKEIVSRKCTNHWMREAAARCPECKRYFCRECVTEHEGRVLCAACIGREEDRSEHRHVFTASALRLIQGTAGFLVLWIMFYYLGRILLLIPASFHEGTLWQK